MSVLPAHLGFLDPERLSPRHLETLWPLRFLPVRDVTSALVGR